MEKFNFILFIVGVVIMLATLIIDMFANVSGKDKMYLSISFGIGLVMVITAITYQRYGL